MMRFAPCYKGVGERKGPSEQCSQLGPAWRDSEEHVYTFLPGTFSNISVDKETRSGPLGSVPSGTLVETSEYLTH